LGGKLSSLFSEQYRIGKDYYKIRLSDSGWFCCCTRKSRKEIPNFREKWINLKASQGLLQQRMDLQNYIHDGLDLFAMKQLI